MYFTSASPLAWCPHDASKGSCISVSTRVMNAECRVRSAELTPEACFQKALAIACRQQAKALELRAALSLSRLWQQHGKRHPARQVLTTVYGGFSEGFATPDLQEVKARLR